MSAYAAGTDIYFNDPHGGVDVTYRAGGTGAPLALRVVKLTPPPQVQYGDIRVRVDAAQFEMRVADVASPAPGDTLQLGTLLYTVQGAPSLDETGTVWLVDVSR